MISIRLLLVLAALLPSAQEDKRADPPDAAAQKSAEKLVRDVFKDEFAKKAVADRVALAKRLIQQSAESKDDPVARFVLLKEAQSVAQQAGDLSTALQAVDQMGQFYRVDFHSMKAGILSASEKNAKTPPEFKQLVERYLDLADESAAADRVDVAEKAAAAASAVARKAKELVLISKSDAKSKELAALKTKLQRLKKARETLTANPEDGAANSLVGYDECAARGNWAVGLPMLVKGSDATIRGLAEKDLAGTQDAQEQVAIADGWWSLAEKETGTTRDRLKERAVQWYDRALPRLTGLALAKAEKRASESRSEKLMRGTWIDMGDSPGIDLGIKKGEPLVLDGSRMNTGIHADVSSFTSGVYDGFAVRFRTLDGTKGQIRFKFESQHRIVYLDAEGGRFAAMSRPRGVQNWTTDFDKPAPVREEQVVTVLFDNGFWVAYLDGREMVRLKTSLTHLESFGVCAFKNKVSFLKMHLRKKE